MSTHKSSNPLTRREALCRVGNGFGMMAFAGMLSNSLAKARRRARSRRQRRSVAKLDYPQRVKRVIFLFMNGGSPHVDSFDPKPALEKYDGQPLPGGHIKTERRTGELMKSPFKFKKYGQCGMEVSEFWPHLGEVADDICWVRSVYTDIPNHEPSCLMMNTGANQAGRPSMGAWLTYGLGTENQNLPGYVVLCPDVPTTVGPPLWSNGFLPAINQGTFISNRVQTAADTPGGRGWRRCMTEEMPRRRHVQRQWRKSLRRSSSNAISTPRSSSVTSIILSSPWSNSAANSIFCRNSRKCAKTRPAPTSRWKRVIKSMEVAYRMQTEAPEVFDVRKESQATLDLYGPGPVRAAA